MANYTMELRKVEEYEQVFTFNYIFYSNDRQERKDFENLFINHFYFHEIGCETIDRWKHMLKARLDLIMPYYQQLYKTEWERTGKDMLQSKDLTETTTRKIEQTGEMTDTSQATSSGEGTSNASNIGDGVNIVNLNEGNKTSMSNTMSSSESQSSSSSNTESNLKETITFNSKGDVGIQTPAYAITEWRKVIININMMIIKECADLFMQIY